MRVAVVGAGIAGIACAVRLAESGVAVTLLEARRRPGGRASSFDDARTGRTFDNCQHVVLRCCTNYLDLLDRLGVAGTLAWTREQYWLEPGGRETILRPAPLPAPLHFGPSFLGAKFLSVADKAAIALALQRLALTDAVDAAGLSFADLLERWHQPRSAIARFWFPVVVSACNLPPERVAAPAALKVFHDAFLASSSSSDIGLATTPLVRLYDALGPMLARAGGSLELGQSVRDATPTTILRGDGPSATPQRFDAVVVAVPYESLRRTIHPDHHDARVSALDDMPHSPILGVHMVFDRPVMPRPHAVLVDRPTQWIFRHGLSLHAVVSAADAWMDLPEPEIARRVLDDLRMCFPRSWWGIGAGEPWPEPTAVRAVKERRATFACTPAFEGVRPTIEPTAPNRGLILAGDYTAVGWPATMEGATRSGYLAAGAVLRRLGRGPAGGRGGPGLVPDMPARGLSAVVARLRTGPTN